MSAFKNHEIAYLTEVRLGRLATAGADGQPHVVPVGFRYAPDADAIDVGGHGLEQTKKFRDVQVTGRAALVVDDLASVTPWRPRGVLICGEATAYATGGERLGPGFGRAWLRISPRRVISWGLDADQS